MEETKFCLLWIVVGGFSSFASLASENFFVCLLFNFLSFLTLRIFFELK
jgi:hypothetical protein